MAKFNTRANSSVTSSPKSAITTTGPARTYEGGKAYSRDAKSDLFLLAVTNMVGEDTFYEKARNRDDRYAALVRQVTLEDPAWMYRFIGWLRNKANMRSASVVAAAEAVLARREARVNEPFEILVKNSSFELDGLEVLTTRSFIPQAMARADEPGEFVAYWAQRTGSKTLPGGVQRGLSDAMVELFDEYAYTKYGQPEHGFQLGDLVAMVHPAHKAPWQADLWEHALNERHNREAAVPDSLTMLQARKDFMAIPQNERRAFLDSRASQTLMKKAGITWEQLSGWLGGSLDATFWESLIFSKQLGYMAMLRNLRNFEKAGISKAARKAVQERLADPEQVAKSRQFPFRFLSAYRAVEGDWWSEALSDALDASVGNLPKFHGKTMVMVDTSGSMRSKISQKSSVSHLDIGALFGVALAKAGMDAELWGFADGVFRHELPKGGSVLRGIESFNRKVGSVGHGTETVKALKHAYDGHARVILISDMQAFADYSGGWWGSRSTPSTKVTNAVPADTVMYGINPGGYSSTALDLSQRNRYEIGGFSDQVFRMMSLIEAGNADWPF